MSRYLKIAIIALILLIFAGTGLLYLNKKDNTPPQKCDVIFSPECQDYLFKVTKEKNFEEAISIQKRRIDENLSILKRNERKMKDKSWLSLTFKEAEKKFNELGGSVVKNEKNARFDKDGNPIFEDYEKDYYLLKYNSVTIRDIVLDTMIISTMQRREFKDFEAAKATLEKGKKILSENMYAEDADEYMKMLDRNIKKAEEKR